MTALIDMVGQKLSRLTVIRRGENSAVGHIQWDCICECGSATTVDGRNLRSGHTRSCGCLLMEELKARVVHGHTVDGQYSDEFKVWMGMHTRCTNANEKGYYRYGGRGITVCDRWQEFANFYDDMGPRPSPDHSIERKKNDANYEPSNCKWATRKEQCRNRRSNRIVSFRGRQMSLAEAVEISGLPYFTVSQRIGKLGWDDERALTEPVNGRS